mgnify:FL=1
MKRVVLLPTIRKETDKDYTLRATERFRMHGAEVRFDEAFAGEAFTADAVLCGREELFSGIDLIVVLGGDGSILRAAEYALMCDVPLLGINFGRVGYMAELEKHEIPLIDRIYSGDYTIQNRMTMQAEKKTPEGTVLLSDSVLNEVAVGRGAYPKCIDLRLYADDCMVRNIRADGVVFATPTGSSAYSMAAGGCVVDPTLECICVTPVCPISRYACPFVFSGETVLELANMDDRAPHVDVTADGTEPVSLYLGERLILRRSPRTLKMLKLKHAGFFSVLNAKLAEYELKN